MYDWDPTFMKLVAIVRRFLETALAFRPPLETSF
jgi:hypothetical protein